MSNTNGTALATSADAPDEVARTSGAGDYIRGMEDTAPLDVVDQPRPGPDPHAVVRELETQVEVAENIVNLQGKRALVEQMFPEEMEEERAVELRRRAVEREFQTWEIGRSLRSRKWQARRQALRAWRDDRAKSKDRSSAADDRRWHVKAQRTRTRLTSPDARIATQIRSATRWSNLLISLMIVGMAYTGFTVQANFVPSGNTGDPRYWLSLGLEAMCSVALMALMRFDARAALAGRVRTGREAFWGWTVKGGLLLASLAAAAGPAIAAGDRMAIVANGWAPVLVASVLLIHDRISRGDSEILLELYRATEREGLRDLVAVAEFALRQGLLAPSQDNKPGEIAPSASKLATFFRISKENAAHVRDRVNARGADVTA
ncbi:hypothetical protein L3Q65_00030 (plasmid) [Amycolatopsis sp. FU40]|uniref:hypothetical protein n=1 Tax=Amycolatopsis sp. FU40 TaxID=2914159 RepID=UPI001F32A332|nr:hypothetical protein [Amycolatopsis sp. FU40]UKD50747.1 hypothetical protein L3Q65_00030 [Amycolatopsis sp. FU40]